MAQRFPTSGPSAAPPPGPMQPQQRYPGPAQPPGSPMPPRPYPGPNFPVRFLLIVALSVNASNKLLRIAVRRYVCLQRSPEFSVIY